MRKWRRDRGQSIVELAIVLPLLLLILLGCLDLGRAFAVRMALANGAREGARYASKFPDADPSDLEAMARQDIAAQGLDDSKLHVSVTVPDTQKGGLSVQVTAEYSLPMFTTYLFGGKPLVIRARSEMVILGGF